MSTTSYSDGSGLNFNFIKIDVELPYYAGIGLSTKLSVFLTVFEIAYTYTKELFTFMIGAFLGLSIEGGHSFSVAR